MKLLVLCPRFPYPLEKGDKLRIYHQLRYLSKNHEIFLFTLTDIAVSEECKDKVRDYVQHMEVMDVDKIDQFASLVMSVFNGLPFQVAINTNNRVNKRLDTIVKEFKPDHIYCQLARMGEYARKYKLPKTIDYMDAFGVGMERRAEVVTGLKSWVYSIEARRMKRYERELYDSFDNHTVISKQDAKCINCGANSEFTIVPNGIDTVYFTQERTPDKMYDIGFVGNMGYPPNVDAAEYLVNEVIKPFKKELSVIIAGARPDKRVKLLEDKNVVITGWIDDVREAYAKTRVFVAPLWSGTGQQNKILEAMAMGIPCVTTSAVNNAIGAENGKEILVADDVHAFQESIDRLLNDRDIYSQIRENARNFVQSNFSWSSSVNILEELFKK